MSIKHKLLASAAVIGTMLLAPVAYAAPSAMMAAPLASVDVMLMPALADGPALVLADADTPSLILLPAAVEPNSDSFGEETVALADLDTMIGAQGIPLALLTDQTLSAFNTGNSLTAAQIGSGEIKLDANAFSGFSGIGNFVINSGHNNNLQSSLSVNIVLAQ